MKSNLPEIWAVRLALVRFWDVVRNNNVLIRTDNILLKAYINKQGRSKSSALHTETAWIMCGSEWNFKLIMC